MQSAKRLAVVFLTMVVWLGTASVQQFTIKKKKLKVTVEENTRCPRGISVSGDSLQGRQLCADYPEGAVGRLQKYVGSTVEMEAFWTFVGEAPVALGTVSMIGTESVVDACPFKGTERVPCNLYATASGKKDAVGRQ
jgi:hypothetical protein